MADLSRQVETRVIRSWKFWMGCALLAGLIWLVEANFGWNRIAASWAVIPPQQLAVAIALMAASYLLRALRFYDFFYQWTQGRFGALLSRIENERDGAAAIEPSCSIPVATTDTRILPSRSGLNAEPQMMFASSSTSSRM